MRKRRGRRAPILLILTLASGCGDATGPGPEDEGVDLAALFAPPTTNEVVSILADWTSRAPASAGVEVLNQTLLPFGSQGLAARIVSHDVDGVEHVGAIFTPVGAQAETLPILVYSHGGDQGENLDLTLLLLPLVLEDDIDEFVFVVPSFRSEALVFDGVEYPSGGEPSPWDRDVDDALSLLEVVIATTPEADPDRIGVLGFSRGANVALLMAIRDPRIDAVVEFFGPTDFFGDFVQEVVADALAGEVRNLPGVAFLNQEFIQPLSLGSLSIDEVRLELLRRSPVYFADRIPDLQVHHGTADTVVPVGEGRRLIQVMEEMGRGPPGFEGFIYEGGTHSPLALPGSLPRTQEFLRRLLGY
jgi:dipeptidyl aminopeptidase/acylaminoacyl peptidase